MVARVTYFFSWANIYTFYSPINKIKCQILIHTKYSYTKIRYCQIGKEEICNWTEASWQGHNQNHQKIACKNNKKNLIQKTCGKICRCHSRMKMTSPFNFPLILTNANVVDWRQWSTIACVRFSSLKKIYWRRH